jgi:hypothetical protein
MGYRKKPYTTLDDFHIRLSTVGQVRGFMPREFIELI